MRALRLALGVLFLGSSAAAACGSSDKQVMVREGGGAGGEGGASAPAKGGSTANQGGSNVASPQGGGGGELEGTSGAAGGEAGELGGASGATNAGGSGGAPSAGEGGTSSDPIAGAGGEGGAASSVVLDLGFDEGKLPDSLDPGTAVLTPAQGYAELGPIGGEPFGSTFLRGPTGTVITLTLTDLPPHSTLSISMLFAAIDSLDGEGTFPAGDYFKITLDGNIVFRETFANAIPSQVQTYDPPEGVVLARHVDLGFSGPGGYYTDSAYDFGKDPQFQQLPHSASSATLVFTLEGEGVQSVDDESWAIDNLVVTVD